MKLSSASAKGARNALRERQRRDRAAAQPLRVIYPQLTTLRLEFKFKEEDVTPLPAPQTFTMHPPANAYFLFPCPYADCEGEFDLSSAVGNVLREQGTHADGQLQCSGHRNRERVGRSPCNLHLEYSIEALHE